MQSRVCKTFIAVEILCNPCAEVPPAILATIPNSASHGFHSAREGKKSQTGRHLFNLACASGGRLCRHIVKMVMSNPAPPGGNLVPANRSLLNCSGSANGEQLLLSFRPLRWPFSHWRTFLLSVFNFNEKRVCDEIIMPALRERISDHT